MKRFLACLVILLLGSCTKIEESHIPYAPVFLNLDLRFQDKDLVGLYNYKYITKISPSKRAIGYSGILLICGMDASGDISYFAFDLCCPHEARKNITIEADNAGKATCPECGTVFDIGWGTGAPTEGVSKYPLRRYITIPQSTNGMEWIVTNKK